MFDDVVLSVLLLPIYALVFANQRCYSICFECTCPQKTITTQIGAKSHGFALYFLLNFPIFACEHIQFFIYHLCKLCKQTTKNTIFKCSPKKSFLEAAIYLCQLFRHSYFYFFCFPTSLVFYLYNSGTRFNSFY